MDYKPIKYCFMEVSSIGVEQDRVTGLNFRMGIFSNLTHDHLDYHKTFAEYLRCKKLFFDNLPKSAIALINADDRNGAVMVQNTKAQVVTYSVKGLADHTARILEQSFEGMQLKIDGVETWVRLIGEHNAYNLLAIYSTAVCLGMDAQETLVALSRLESAPGRLENLQGPKDLSVVIDYAHTPDALENVLGTLRAIAPERQLICLFGCGGDRDKTKRPEMAQVAEKLADRLVITSDNPRTEVPEAIIEDIRKGLSPAAAVKTLVITDRREAIRTAILTAPEGATILVAGKGHETYQIVGHEKHQWVNRSDRVLEGIDPELNTEDADFWTKYNDGVFTLVPDGKLGRLNIPSELLESAGITKEVVFGGVGYKLQIWDPEAMKEELLSDKQFKETASRLSAKK